MDESNRKKIIRKGIFALLLIVLVWNLVAVGRGSEEVKGFSMKEYICTGIQGKVLETILPFAAFQTEEKGQENLLEEMVLQQTPFLLYAKTHKETAEIVEENYFYELLLEEQGKESDVENGNLIENEETNDMLAAMEAENAAAKEVMAQENKVEVSGNDGEMADNKEQMQQAATEEAESAVNILMPGESNFQKVLEKQNSYDWSSFPDTDSVVKEFYAVDNTTSASAANINLESFLKKDLTVDKNSEGYQILIFHTHSQEAFADSVPGDVSTTIVGAGERLAEILTKEY